MPHQPIPPGPLTAEKLRTLLHYEPTTGAFTRLKGRGGNAAGSPVGAIGGYGYLRIGVDRKDYDAHRLAWLYMTGKFPEKMIDHINGNRADSRWCNLREADRSLNNQNLRHCKKSNLSSGLLGVSRNRNKWKAEIYCAKKKYHIGVFDTPQLAHEAYLAKKRQLHVGCTI